MTWDVLRDTPSQLRGYALVVLIFVLAHLSTKILQARNRHTRTKLTITNLKAANAITHKSG